MKYSIRSIFILTTFTLLLVSCGGNDDSEIDTNSGLVVTTLAGAAVTSGSADGIGSSARFWGPQAITCVGNYLYVVDCYNHTIRKIDINTGDVTTFAGTPEVFGSTDGFGSGALFYYPQGITTDGQNLFIADGANSTIRKIVISTREVTTLAGTVGVIGSDDGIGSAAFFDGPTGITTDGANLYVTDPSNATIRKIVLATNEVSTLAGLADKIGRDDGIGSSARFMFPTGITTDGVNIYLLDSYLSNTVRKIDISTGEVTTFAGSLGVAGSSDGIGLFASFNSPDGIITDGINIYVADGGNRSIRKIVIATAEVTTIVGSSDRPGATDGDVSIASFFNPTGIVLNGKSLYVVDSVASTIRKIE